jgi:hypothetical protein
VRRSITNPCHGARLADFATPDYVFVDEHNRHKRLKGERAKQLRTRSGASCN